MTAAKPNPGMYPVPQEIHDWIISQRKAAGKKGSGPKIVWWPTPALRKAICNLIAAGATLSAIAEQPEFPSMRRILAWVGQGREAEQDGRAKERTHPDIRAFHAQWVRACVLRLEHDVDEMRTIEQRLIEVPQKILSEQIDAKGRHYPVPNPAALDPQAARIVLENRRWRLSREMPHRFGDKSKVEHHGSVKVERPRDHMPEWMKARLDDAAAKPATDRPPAPQEPEKPPKTIH